MHQLTPRDTRGIPFVAEQSFVRIDHLGQWFAPNLEPAATQATAAASTKRGGPRPNFPRDWHKRIHTTRQVVDKWVEMGYARLHRPEYHQPIWISITQPGLEEFGLTRFKVGPFPKEYKLPHFYQITRVRLELARASKVPPHSWISERTLETQMPEAQRGVSQPHLPDGVLQLKSGNRIAVEVELTQKEKQELHRVLNDLLASYSAIWYFCSQKTYTFVDMELAAYPDEARRRFTLFHLEEEDAHLKI